MLLLLLFFLNLISESVSVSPCVEIWKMSCGYSKPSEPLALTPVKSKKNHRMLLYGSWRNNTIYWEMARMKNKDRELIHTTVRQ